MRKKEQDGALQKPAIPSAVHTPSATASPAPVPVPKKPSAAQPATATLPVRSIRAKVALPEGMANHFVSELPPSFHSDFFCTLHVDPGTPQQFIRLVEQINFLGLGTFCCELAPFYSPAIARQQAVIRQTACIWSSRELDSPAGQPKLPLSLVLLVVPQM